MARKLSPVVHLMHYRKPPYTHSYCGWVNYAKKWPGNFTRLLEHVTCRRCLASIDSDGGNVIAFVEKLKVWKKLIEDAKKVGRLPNVEGFRDDE
jgi:hypothetical protein